MLLLIGQPCVFNEITENAEGVIIIATNILL